jgi:hypothetical protein
MKYLIQGGEPAARLQKIISMTGIISEVIKAALEDHYIKGMDLEIAAAINGADKSNLKRATVRLELMAKDIEEIKEMDWIKFGYKYEGVA